MTAVGRSRSLLMPVRARPKPGVFAYGWSAIVDGLGLLAVSPDAAL